MQVSANTAQLLQTKVLFCSEYIPYANTIQYTVCGWQVKLCDPLVTHRPYLSGLEIQHDEAL